MAWSTDRHAPGPRPRLAAALLLTLALGPAAAQTLYRCGNVYQDRPCAGSQPAGKVVNTTGAGSPAASRSPLSAACAQRGEAAQKIAWVRETGQTEAMQVEAAAAQGLDAALITEVYRHVGSAAQIRGAIETECMAAAERAAARAAALAGMAPGGEAAAPAPPPSRPLPASMLAPEAPDPQALAQQRAEDAARTAAAQRKAQCEALSVRIHIIRQTQRQGGSPAAQDNLQQQLRSAEQQLRAAGC